MKKRKIIAFTNPWRISAILGWVLLAGTLVAYGYFLVLSITHVVLREELALAVYEEEMRIAKLEVEYLANISSLSEKSAEEMGLVQVPSAGFVAVYTPVQSLTRAE